MVGVDGAVGEAGVWFTLTLYFQLLVLLTQLPHYVIHQQSLPCCVDWIFLLPRDCELTKSLCLLPRQFNTHFC